KSNPSLNTRMWTANTKRYVENKANISIFPYPAVSLSRNLKKSNASPEIYTTAKASEYDASANPKLLSSMLLSGITKKDIATPADVNGSTHTTLYLTNIGPRTPKKVP